jgi:heme/copper-type cytochrome/quinol oxidase subunit 3
MVMLLGAETMFFAGLVAAFLVLRVGAPVWPPPFQPRLPVLVTGLNTLVLLASGVAMARALRAVNRGDHHGLMSGLRLTALFGALFLAVQGYEWARLVQFGLTASSGSYGSAFYTLIGAHGLHVLAALCWLAVVLVFAARRRFTPGNPVPVSVCGMYWQFVVALWPVLYLLVYLV